MASADYELTTPPREARERELWLEHAAGFVLFEDVRRYAIEALPSDMTREAREAALKAIDAAVYGLMMVIDGVPGSLRNDEYEIQLRVSAQLLRGREVIAETGIPDGACMGFHGWREGDFGKNPVAARRRSS